MEKSKKRHRYKRRILSGFTSLLLLMAVVGCLYIMWQSLSNGYVRCGKTSLFRVITGSMEPTIPTGAVLVAKETEIESIRENDIVCFHSTNPGSEGLIVTHRVVGIYQNPDGTYCLQTQGDNKETNPTMDVNPVTEQNLIGRVTWHTGDGSTMAKIINFLTGEVGFLACIILPVLLIAVWVFRDAAKNLRREIRSVEEDLDRQEKQRLEKQRKQQAQKPTLSEEEYKELYAKIEQEVRKEMEQHASANAESEAVVQEDGSTSAAAPSDEAQSGESAD